MSDDVTLTHPDADPITVSARKARVLRKQGWQDAAVAQTSTPPSGVSPVQAPRFVPPED